MQEARIARNLRHWKVPIPRVAFILDAIRSQIGTPGDYLVGTKWLVLWDPTAEKSEHGVGDYICDETNLPEYVSHAGALVLPLFPPYQLDANGDLVETFGWKKVPRG